MSNRNLFSELSLSLSEAKEHSEGKLTLKTVKIEIEDDFVIFLSEIISIRKKFNMSQVVFAKYLQTSSRTLEDWEQGRSCPNGQATTLLRLVEIHPETLSQIAAL